MNAHGQPTYKRQRYLLAFVSQLPGDGIRSTYLQKLVFLNMMETKLDYYDFIPYKYGPYSFQLAEDIDILLRDGFLVRGEKGLCSYSPQSETSQFNIAIERGDALIRKAYRAYPYYSINSEIISRLFAPKEAQQFLRERNRYKQTDELLFTIGYEGRSVESFLNTLIQQDIHVLCDVRKNPISRKFGFSKSKLQHMVEAIGIRYIHYPDLGIESEKRVSLSSEADYESLFSDYTESLPSKSYYLSKVYDLLKQNSRIALMCYEKEPQMCHRHVIRDYLVSHYPIRSYDL
ncbi:MAG: DUF488 family protein [Oscillospiraceae bacterium]|nr:DUF488 family protein [Oscillospiraceae bacterium]